ncbi:hypothetical protein BsWGS_04309 [Bradybaena similaris]
MPRSNKTAVELVNISLVHCGTDNSANTPLGVVIVPKNLMPDLCLPLLRQIMKQQLCQVLPEKFVFCSKTKHDIQFAQENNINVKQICDSDETILIRSSHDIPRLIVRCAGMFKGHIFSNFTSSLTDLRTIIYTSIPELDDCGKSFTFVYSDGSLVPVEAEDRTPVHEVLRGCEVYIGITENPSEVRDLQKLPSKWESQVAVSHNKAQPMRLSFTSSKDIDHQSSDNSVTGNPIVSNSKQLLISYVSAEAAEHAVNLKRRLTRLGYSVFLDVHEIKSGVDWQDALNYAVSNCEVFIPLVTPRYGETQWTNREVKLADVLGKPILPVSFLDEWPPKCLAIQFATTQFIWWKSPENISLELAAGNGEEARNIRIWKDKYIEIAALEIEKRLKIMKSAKVSKPALKRMKTLVKTFAGRLPATISPELTRQDSEETPGPQIVVCVHPCEASYGFQLKDWLEEAGYSVWTLPVLSSFTEFGSTDLIAVSKEASHKAEAGDNKENTTEIVQTDEAETPIKITADQVNEFQEVVDRATVVIIVLSKAFTESWICRQQVYYCEHRKQILPIVYEEFRVPCWLKMLIRTKKLLSVNKSSFYQILLMQVKRALDPTAKNCLETDSLEANKTLAVDYLKRSLDVRYCVYVSGATKFSDTRSEAVCRSIGTHLAQLGNVAVVTGGCYGTSEHVGRTFHEECKKRSMKSKVWHILPEQDSQDMSERYNQSSDGTFALKDFGQTLFCGNSVWEKEAIVGRCFQICLLIEGGPDASHEVEEFVWNDHIIIPVYCAYETDTIREECRATGKMFPLPPGVSEWDWKCLSDRTTSVEEVGTAIRNIISDLLKHLENQAEMPVGDGSELQLSADV